MIILLTSCTQKHDEVDDSHSHGEQVTVYSNHFELYAEVESLIVGEESGVLAHLTRLDDFSPVDSTRVELVLSVRDKIQRYIVEMPENAGIYRFKVVPALAGVGTMRFEVKVADSVESITHHHVHVYATHEEMHRDEYSHTSDMESITNTIIFTKEQSWKVNFATELVRQEIFGQVIKTSAQILPSKGDEREVSAKASGIIVFNNPNLVEGSKVQFGQKLFSIESSGMADNNMGVKFREASAIYRMAKDEYDRKANLAKDKIVTESELQRAKMELETAQAVYDNLKNNFSERGEFVSAPLSGYVQKILVRNGSYVEAGQQIMLVSQNRDLFVRAEVSPRYFKDLSHIEGANMQLMNDDRVYDLNDLDGGLVSYGRSTDLNNPLIPVTFRFRNSIEIMSGGFVTLYIRTQSDDKVVTVSNAGIVEIMGSYFVFVQITPELFEKRAVKLGGTDGIRTVVESGIEVGERVVSEGAMMVKMAQSNVALDPHAGHIH